MVYRDISNDVELNKIGRQAVTSADLLDRFFSFLIDYLVISPFVMFFLYIIFQNGFHFLRLNPMAPENALFQLLAGVCYVLIFAMVQTCFVGLWKATPGQYFLKLRFETDQSTGVLQFRIFFRQVLVWGSFLFLGLPFLSMLTNKKRRTFYDQIADVSVVTFKQGHVSVFSFETEHRYWQALLMTFSLFLAGLFAALVSAQYADIVNRVASFKEYKKQAFFCPQLDHVEGSERLEVAIALNLVDQLSDDCLDREADFVLWRQKEKDINLAYWAKSLTANEKDKEKQYQQKVCQTASTTDARDVASRACDFAQAFEQNKFAELIPTLNEDSLLSLVLKYKLTQIVDAESGKERDTTALLGEIEKYRDIKLVRKYLITEMLNIMPEQTEGLTGTIREPASIGDGPTVLQTDGSNDLPMSQALDPQMMKLLPFEDAQKANPQKIGSRRHLTPAQIKTEKIIELMGDL